ncbi:MAG TPA: adenine phosphoribosyltransferase [Steroidobacteraceae bacterium]|nr:adenine phosphoribosyltransferase [Steroidobacteraceae bacterium]HRX89396.1 adenine phosphoribosyltransferase [Steroidobacteraceae bacterium]
MDETDRNLLERAVRVIPDYPRPGVQFRDITTLLNDRVAFAVAIKCLTEPWLHAGIEKVAGIEARGFILGGAVAHQLNAGFVPIRKKGKLPHTTVGVAYSLEYGIDEIEMHTDALREGERVLLIDDLIATGGSASAAAQLLKGVGAVVVAGAFVIKLPELGGTARLAGQGVPVRALLSF